MLAVASACLYLCSCVLVDQCECMLGLSHLTVYTQSSESSLCSRSQWHLNIVWLVCVSMRYIKAVAQLDGSPHWSVG